MSETKAVVRKADQLPAPLLALVQSVVPDCNALLPADITTEQFRAALWLELTGRPALTTCSLDSLRTCIVQAAADGMLPGRDCHFLPFSQKGQTSRRATKVDNYHGLQRALERTGKVAHSWAAPVCENDEYNFDRFLPRPTHQEAMTLGKKPGKVLFFYGAILFKDGSCAFETMSLEALKAVENSSPSHETGPWRDWPEMMQRKSALKRVCKYAPVTPEIERLLETDDERLQQDIPPERHRQNIIDLFGDDQRGSTGEIAVSETAEKAPGVPKDEKPAPGASESTDSPTDVLEGNPEPPAPNAWRDTLMAHRDNELLPEGLRVKMKLALNPGSKTTDAQGLALASAALDILDNVAKDA